MAMKKLTDKHDEVTGRYLNGESTHSLSNFYSVDDGVIRRILKASGVTLRSRSEALSKALARKGTHYTWLLHRLEEPFDDDCVDWPFNKDYRGKGTVKHKRDTRSVPHIVLRVTGRERPEPPNHNALHSCDNPSCFNPHHLAWGTQKQNVEQCFDRGRRYEQRNS